VIEILIIIGIYVFGLLGIIGHWATRYIQARTASSLWDYLKTNAVYTFASLSAGMASSSAVTVLFVPGMTIQQIILLFGAAYTGGYTCDSTFNKEKSQPEEPKVIEVETHEDPSLEEINNRLDKLNRS
jgi:uncharacterized membrane protein YesL